MGALTSPTVTGAEGHAVPNPIYENLDPTHYQGAVRDPSMVVYAAATGVPWQLVARQSNGVPKCPERRLQDRRGARARRRRVHPIWGDIAGNPEHYVPARSPFMVESTVPRYGTDPITSVSLTMSPTENPINGFEVPQPPDGGDGIQFPCIPSLPAPVDCSADVPAGMPVRRPRRRGEPPVLTQPRRRRPALALDERLRRARRQAPGHSRGPGGAGRARDSICAAQSSNPTRADYAYRPSMKAVVDRIQQGLGPQSP